MRGKFPQTCKHFNSPKNDIKSSLGYFHITGTLPMSLNFILKFLREARGKFRRGNIPRDSTGKVGGNIHVENSPSFPRGNHAEISAGVIPWNSPVNPRGNMGDRDGSPAGSVLIVMRPWIKIDKILSKSVDIFNRNYSQQNIFSTIIIIYDCTVNGTSCDWLL